MWLYNPDEPDYGKRDIPIPMMEIKQYRLNGAFLM
jgi:hypothetical protein